MNRHRILAHRYSDEIAPPRQTIEPVITTWREAVVIILQAGAVGIGGYVLLVLLFTLAAPAPVTP